MTTPPSGLLFDEWEIELHGHRVIYRIAGDGPPVVLIHGMVNSSRHWEEVALRLADRYTVVAPDLLGHGDSAAVRGDYSLGAHACSIRDLLTTIGIERATIVGHSLGGGIAMQFFYQFPQRVERLALISSGGLGHDVSPMLRGAALPGATTGIWLVANRRVRAALDRAGERMRARGIRKGVYLQAVARAMRPLQDAAARRAFLQTLRSVIDVRGQHVSAMDRLYLLGELPTLIVWGGRDHTIPMEHGLAAHELIPNSRFVTLPKAAHFPNLEDPEGLADAVRAWLDETEPGLIEDSEWGQIIGARAPRRQRPAPEEVTPSPARSSDSPE
ncbi:MAG TPA: alpha/beta hydrolase [Solirubrobacterales bacterium]|nr:alpha/beta hydrolase [Solirubrobacterales bacterium]